MYSFVYAVQEEKSSLWKTAFGDPQGTAASGTAVVLRMGHNPAGPLSKGAHAAVLAGDDIIFLGNGVRFGKPFFLCTAGAFDPIFRIGFVDPVGQKFPAFSMILAAFSCVQKFMDDGFFCCSGIGHSGKEAVGNLDFKGAVGQETALPPAAFGSCIYFPGSDCSIRDADGR